MQDQIGGKCINPDKLLIVTRTNVMAVGMENSIIFTKYLKGRMNW